MKAHVRLLSALLAAALLLPAFAPARAAASGAQSGAVTGSISATLRMDYAQRISQLARREVQAELFQDKTSLGVIPLYEEGTVALAGGGQAQVSIRFADGGDLTSGVWPDYVKLTADGLPQGSYTLRFTGEGYVSYEHTLTIAETSMHLTLGTGDALLLGDVNGDGAVTRADADALSAALSKTDADSLARFDLNGDEKVDVLDLAIVTRSMGGEMQDIKAEETDILNVVLDDTDAIRKEMELRGTSMDGELEDLFTDGGETVRLSSAADDGEIVLPVTLKEPVEMSQIEIVSPEGGKPLEGSVAVEDESGQTLWAEDFNLSPQEGVHYISRTENSSVITVNLGGRVAVKKITITVTKTETGYAEMESIRFLRDIVPENPVAPYSQVKNLKAEAGDGQVSLQWDMLPNVSGYVAEYWVEGEDSQGTKQVRTELLRTIVSGLKNDVTYCFTVTPVDGSWTGKPAEPVTATPQAAKAPDAPDMVSVTELDSALRVSWKASKNAAYYEVYYKPAEDSAYLQAGGQLTGTSTVIGDLTNGVTYSIYVVAGNAIGKSGNSRIHTGTPQATDYSRPDGIPTEGLLDSGKIKSIELADKGNHTAGSFDPKCMIDGDFQTAWTAQNWWRNEHVVVTFTQPVDLSSVIWVPRLDGSYPTYLRAYSVTVWLEGDDLNGAGRLIVPDPAQGGVDSGGTGRDVDTWPAVRGRSGQKFVVLPFEPAKGVVKISVAVEQRDYLTVSLSELMFVEYDPAHSLPDNIAALFTDELRTQLRADVTQAEIDALSQRLQSDESCYYMDLDTLADELALAKELLENGKTSGVILDGVDSRSAAADSKRYSQSGSELQPLGAAAKANQEITIYASGIPAGETVTVYATQFNAEVSAWQAAMGTLENGRNILTVPKIGSQNSERGGSLYFTYSGASPEGIKLHVRRAADIPMLDLSDWYAMDESARKAAILAYVDELTAYAGTISQSTVTTNCLNVTEIATPTVLLSIPATAVMGGNSGAQERAEALYNSVLAWEDLMHICKTTQGIDNTYEKNDMQSRQNIRCMQMFSGAFMYAAGSHIGIGYGSCSGVVGGKPLSKLGADAAANSLFGWGIAHEVGHNMDKLGKAEITNNIYALMVQTSDGKQATLASRLEKSGKYASIFTKTALGQPGASNDVFTQLGLYWQLHLAYDNEQPMDFYNRFFKAWKAGTYFSGAATYDDRVALTAAGVAGKDLTQFFTRWGMTLSAETKEKLGSYEEETRAVWYLSDQSRRARLQNTAAASGSITVSAALDSEAPNQINVTIESNVTGTLQGYEIRRGDQAVAFVIPAAEGKTTVYQDVIGSGNHRTYVYTVTAYDILGNKTAEGKTDEVRVAYDSVVDPSRYTIAREDGAVVIEMTEETAISGLKLTGEKRPASGEFTVTVTAQLGTGEDGDPVELREVTARTGSFDSGNQAVDDMDSYLTYFNKPGTGSTDTRIWTYDAAKVVITGIPEDMPLDDIRLISYAGDDVAFLEPGAVGRLAKDYKYGDGENEVIQAGTLVVVGTYRGDPLYNVVKIWGKFTVTDVNGEIKTEERFLSGETLLFAEIPADNEVSDISDGLFIFIPNLEQEKELQQTAHCTDTGTGLLPGRIKAVLTRTDMPEDADIQRVTAQTGWMLSPGEDDLPAIELEGAQ